MPAKIELRDYQQLALDRLKAGFQAGHTRQILCLPTGGGKTVIAASMIQACIDKGSRVTFVADRLALVDQTSKALFKFGIMHGVLQSGNSFGLYEKIQVCSAQSLEARGTWSDTDLVIIDECHTQRKKTIDAIKALDKPTIGLTATPFSSGLNDVYSNVVNARTTNQLIADKWLVPLEVYCATPIDMKGAKVNNGEWASKETGERTMAIVGDIVTEWTKHVYKVFKEPVKTLVFSADVATGYEICRQFQMAGHRFEQISYLDTDSDERNKKIEAYRNGDVMGLVSVDALAKGFDVPDTLCLVDARPLRSSVTAHIQKLGRVMRSSPETGKEFGLLLDHAGNFLRHSAFTEQFWANGVQSLPDAVKRVEKQKETRKKDEDGDTERQCYGCGYVLQQGMRVCPMCGKGKTMKKSRVSVQPGRMSKYADHSEASWNQATAVGDIWPHVCRLAVDKHPTDTDKALRFARAQHKNLTGNFPRWGRRLEPTPFCDTRVRDAVEASFKQWLNERRKEGYAKSKS